MNDFIKLFRKVGGKEIIHQYIYSHVLLFALTETIHLGFSKKALELVRNAVNYKQLTRLRKEYQHIIQEKVEKMDLNLPRRSSNKIWICWFQGMEYAPDIVKKCYTSMTSNIKNHEFVVITEKNYKNYVKFPLFIQKKYESGIITKTHFSDLLRLELLIRYGGTWADSTLYCSGDNIPSYFFDSDLFLFQCLKPGLDGHCTAISSWFITAKSNNPILRLTRDLLYDYWKHNNKMINYFLLHDFFQLAIETFPEEWAKVVPFSNSIPHILLLRLFEPYDQTIWNAVKEMTPFHKLTYKFDEECKNKENTYFKHLFD